MNSSRYLLDLAAKNFGWTPGRPSEQRVRYERGNLVVEAWFTRIGTVRSAYLMRRSGAVDQIVGGVPAVTDTLRAFGAKR